MINIFIPIGGVSAWEDNELRYCLRSLETNLKSEFNVTVYSDHPIDWLRNTAFEIIPRYLPPGKEDRNFENFWDTLNKIHEYAWQLDDSEFVYMYDDCCLIRPCFDLNAIHNVALQLETPDLAPMRKDKHGTTVLHAISLLSSIGADYNYETHIPRIYRTKKLLTLFSHFNILNQVYPPALATLYFNYYYPFPFSILSEKGQIFRASFCFEDDPETGCYMVKDEGEIKTACKGKMWLHYNDAGLRFAPWGKTILKDYIQGLFPNKSKFEI